MKYTHKLFVFSFLASLIFTVFGFNFIALKSVNASSNEILNNLVSNPSDYFFTRASLTVDDMTVPALFNFTSNGENDVYWYPGVVSSVAVQGNGGVGTVYNQVLNFGGVILNSSFEIIGRIPNKLIVQKASGAFENYGVYVYRPVAGGKAKITIYGAVKRAPEVTKEGLEFIMNVAYPTLLNYLGKTGTYTVWVSN